MSKPKQVQVVLKAEARLVKRMQRLAEVSGEKLGPMIEEALRDFLEKREGRSGSERAAA